MILSVEEPISIAAGHAKQQCGQMRGPTEPSVERDEWHQNQVI
jgi:hypothetical protein